MQAKASSRRCLLKVKFELLRRPVGSLASAFLQ
jgi:hypothetical protein